eukprot:g80034.t1
MMNEPLVSAQGAGQKSDNEPRSGKAAKRKNKKSFRRGKKQQGAARTQQKDNHNLDKNDENSEAQHKNDENSEAQRKYQPPPPNYPRGKQPRKQATQPLLPRQSSQAADPSSSDTPIEMAEKPKRCSPDQSNLATWLGIKQQTPPTDSNKDLPQSPTDKAPTESPIVHRSSRGLSFSPLSSKPEQPPPPVAAPPADIKENNTKQAGRSLLTGGLKGRRESMKPAPDKEQTVAQAVTSSNADTLAGAKKRLVMRIVVTNPQDLIREKLSFWTRFFCCLCITLVPDDAVRGKVHKEVAKKICTKLEEKGVLNDLEKADETGIVIIVRHMNRFKQIVGKDVLEKQVRKQLTKKKVEFELNIKREDTVKVGMDAATSSENARRISAESTPMLSAATAGSDPVGPNASPAGHRYSS